GLDVFRHGGLAVRAGDHAAQRAEGVRAEAAVDPALHDPVPPLPGAGLGRHREADVFVQQLGEAADVRAFAVGDEAIDQLTLGLGRVRARRPLETLLWQMLSHACARALQAAVDRRDRRLEQLRG